MPPAPPFSPRPHNTPLSTSAPLLLQPKRNQGFSLVELLTVITIFAVFAAIMLPFISGLSDDAGASKDRRNAQSIATAFVAGETAGAEILVPGDLDATIDNIVSGVVVPKGVFAGDLFAVPGLTEADRTAAAQYLSLHDGQLTYSPNL